MNEVCFFFFLIITLQHRNFSYKDKKKENPYKAEAEYLTSDQAKRNRRRLDTKKKKVIEVADVFLFTNSCFRRELGLERSELTRSNQREKRKKEKHQRKKRKRRKLPSKNQKSINSASEWRYKCTDMITNCYLKENPRIQFSF